MRSLGLASLLLAVLAVAPPLRAQTDEPEVSSEVADLLREGVALRAQGRDALALEVFERALALEPLGRARAQRALAEQALARWADAYVHLREALADADPWIGRHREELDAALAAIGAHVGELEIAALPEGARREVDDRTIEEGTVVVEAGEHRVRASLDGHVTTERDVSVGARGHERVEITLVPLGAATAPAPAPAASADASTALFVIGTALTVIGAGVAFGVGMHAESVRSSYEARYEAMGCATMPSCVDHASVVRELDLATGLFHGALGLAAVGGVFVGIGAAVLPSGSDARAMLHVSGAL